MMKKALLWIRPSKLFKSLSIYFISQLITALLPIIIIPIISKSLSIIDYGLYSLYKSIFGFLIPLVGLSFSNAVVRKYYTIEKKDFKSYMFTLMLTVTGAGILLYFLLLININLLLEIFKISNTSIIYYSLFVAYFTSISAILIGYYRVINSSVKYLISNLIIILITILGVIILKHEEILIVTNLLILHLAAIAVSVLYNLFIFFDKESKIEFDFSNLKDTIRYCMPLVLFSLLAQVYALGDRFFINYYLGKDSLAFYSAGLQMAFLIPLVGQSIQLAWTPYVFEQLSIDLHQNKLKKITLVFCGILFLFSVIYVFIYPFIFKVFLPTSYNSVLNYYIYFIVAGLFQSLYWLFNPFLLFREKNSYFVYITLFSAILSFVLNYLFVKNGLVWIAGIFTLSWIVQFISLLLAIAYVKNIKKNQEIHL